MRTEDEVQSQQSHLGKGIFDQESSMTPRSSRSSSSNSSSSSDSSYSSSDRSRSPSVSSRPLKRHNHESRYSSSSSSSSRSRSRSYPRCCRAPYHSRCRHRHRSRSYRPYSRRPSRHGRRRYSRSISRSSSRERYYRMSRRSRSGSSRYRRASGAYAGRVRNRISPSPTRRRYRSRSKSPERSIRLSQKEKIDLLNIARENAAKVHGVDVVKLPASVSYIEEQVKKALESDTERRVRGDPAPLEKSKQDEGEADEDFEIPRTSPSRNPVRFSINNSVAKPSSSPVLHVTGSKVTSRVGNTTPYGKWIPVKTVSTKKR